MRARRIVASVVVLVLLSVLGVSAAAVYYTVTRQPAPWASACTADVGGSTVRLNPAQSRNAAIITAVAGRLGLAPRAASIGLATALQESGLRNLDHGDRDSLGLFQQRPSQGWGTAEQVMDPWYAAGAFYAAMVKVKGWETADIGDVAQAVQKSGYPDAYDKHVPSARVLASALSGETAAAFTCTATSVPPADAAGLSAFLAKTMPKDATVSTSGTTMRVTAPSAADASAVAAVTIADAETHGVRRVSVGGKTWAPRWPFGAAWSSGALAGADATHVVIELA